MLSQAEGKGKNKASALSMLKVRVNPVEFTLTFNCDTALALRLLD